MYVYVWWLLSRGGQLQLLLCVHRNYHPRWATNVYGPKQASVLSLIFHTPICAIELYSGTLLPNRTQKDQILWLSLTFPGSLLQGSPQKYKFCGDKIAISCAVRYKITTDSYRDCGYYGYACTVHVHVYCTQRTISIASEPSAVVGKGEWCLVLDGTCTCTVHTLYSLPELTSVGRILSLPRVDWPTLVSRYTCRSSMMLCMLIVECILTL